MNAKIMPPVYCLAAILIMIGLHIFAPGGAWLTGPARLLGAAVAVPGLGVILWAAGRFRARQTPVKPTRTPTALVTDGPYRHTRNPMYLGLTLILTGIAVCLGTLTPLLLPPAFMTLIHLRFIRNEEKRMTDLFGDAYRDYRARVRRWL